MIYDYAVTTGKGETLNLADYKGKVIIDDELKGRIDDYYRQYGVREA